MREVVGVSARVAEAVAVGEALGRGVRVRVAVKVALGFGLVGVVLGVTGLPM
ncbi:MAG: hypothetical protein HY699_14530 [Deltaproteobacteria bacterium]|nr:hypothetical protein [Deltaproteobacteria bacterium]